MPLTYMKAVGVILGVVWLGTAGSSAAFEVLVIGSTHPFATHGTIKTPAADRISQQVRSLFLQDLKVRDQVNVTVEQIYRTRDIHTAYGQGGRLVPTEYRCHSLAQWYFWPAGRKERLDSLRGKGKIKWDCVVLVGDPYIIANMPGVFAEGVNLIAGAVAESDAKMVLLIPWGSQTSVAPLAEVVCRVGKSAGIYVIPRKWIATVGARMNGPYKGENPFAMKYVSKRSVTYNHTGTSSERGIEKALRAVTQRCRVNLSRANKKQDGEAIDFNYGRGNSNFEKNKQYKVDPSMFSRSYGFPMQEQIKSAAETMLYGIDKRLFDGKSPDDGTDLGIADDMVRQKEVSKDVRCIPIRLMWAKILDHDPGMKPLRDNWHMADYLNDASATFMYTLLSGRCPIGKKPFTSITEKAVTYDTDNIEEKLKTIIIPRLEFDDIPINVVMVYLRKKSRELDKEGKGVDIVWPDTWNTESTETPRVIIDAHDIPLGAAIRFICESANVDFEVTPQTVSISKGLARDVDVRCFDVPPGMFNAKAANRDLTHYFKEHGVAFPRGSEAKLIRDGRTLFVRNTPPNLKLIRKVLQSFEEKNPPVRDAACRSWLGQRVGYETAWRMSHLTARVPGFTVRPSGNVSTIKAKDGTHLSVKFQYPPRHTVTVKVVSDKGSLVTVTPAILTFTPENYDTAQDVRVVVGTVAKETPFKVGFFTKSEDEVFTDLKDVWPYTAISK